MSIVVAVKTRTGTAIAADTLMTKHVLSIPASYRAYPSKIIRCHNTFIGFAGAAAIVEVFNRVIQRHPGKLKFGNANEIFESSVKVRTQLKRYDDVDEEESSGLVFEATIVNPVGIFQLDSGGCVTEFLRFSASGCGSELALGAMHALYNRCEDARTIATAAVEAACEFSGGCGLPVTCHVVGEVTASLETKQGKNGRILTTPRHQNPCAIDDE